MWSDDTVRHVVGIKRHIAVITRQREPVIVIIVTCIGEVFDALFEMALCDTEMRQRGIDLYWSLFVGIFFLL